MFRKTLVASLLTACAFSAQSAVIEYTDFSDTSTLTLNGSTASLTPNSDDVLRLTSTTSQSGSAFISNAISLTADSSFSAFFSFQITNNSGWTDTDGVQGADGLVFVLQTNDNTAGGVGGGIGYQGIGSSLGIEFDTWNNGSWDDNDGNHIGINTNGVINSLEQYEVSTAMNNGSVWYSWVDYDGSADQLEVRFSSTDERPTDSILDYSIDLTTIFGPDDVFVGFSSGTGAAGGQHDILSLTFVDDFQPVGEEDEDEDQENPPPSVSEPSTIAMMGLALFGFAAWRRRQK